MKNKDGLDLEDLDKSSFLITPLEDDVLEDSLPVSMHGHYETTMRHDLTKEQLPDLLKYYVNEVAKWNLSTKNPEEEYSVSKMTADNTFSIMKGQQKVLEITENVCIFTNPIDSKVLDAFADQHKGAEIIVEMCGSATEAKALQEAMKGKNISIKFSPEAIEQMKKTATSADDKYLIATLKIYNPTPIEPETNKHIKLN